jgi:glycosyltransferase involved in cell wall biosynthesis
MPKFSIVIPVYNRPQEVDELLNSLVLSTFDDFEIIIIEDGSSVKCDEVVGKYNSKLAVRYRYQDNSGPGPARNHGALLAKGEYLIFLDSDIIVPSNYLEIVNQYLVATPLDCFGGPDQSHPSFTPIQKAISYAMTSPLTTGGIRGAKKKMDRFYPRSFNLGIKRLDFESINGFSAMRFGEDLDLSMRIIEKGLTTGLIVDAFVYHKRRTNFRAFYKQVFNSGVARINLNKRHPGTLKLVHCLPALFAIGNIALALLAFVLPVIVLILLLPALAFGVDALLRTRELRTAVMSVPASYTQLFGYGTGFIKAYWIRVVLGKDEFHSFKQNFYK